MHPLAADSPTDSNRASFGQCGTYDERTTLRTEAPTELAAWRAALEKAQDLSAFLTQDLFRGFFGTAGRPGEEFRRDLLDLGEDMTRSEFHDMMRVFSGEAIVEGWDVDEEVNGDGVARRWYKAVG